MSLNCTEIFRVNVRPSQGIVNRSTGLDPLWLWRHNVMPIAATATRELPAEHCTFGGIPIAHHGKDPGPL
jgi:hypothetical protein